MIKSISIFLLLANYILSLHNGQNKGSLIIGSNSVQKIIYSTSSNFGRNHDGRKAIDSDYSSSWISDSKGAQWIEIDFGVKRIMNKIVIYPGRKDNYWTIKGFILQFMYNDLWFDFADVILIREKKSNIFNFFKEQEYIKKAEIDLGGIDASKFRIFIPEDEIYNGHAAIAEIETYIGSYKLKYFDARLAGMCVPIRNGLLPREDSAYPTAPRAYRGGEHAGIDILHYHTDESYEPIAITKDIPVLAAKDGIIIRADWDYQPMTVKEWQSQSEYYEKNPATYIKRSFGGIQVWIDHEDGIVTTYNHLSKIDDKIKKGTRVRKGDRIGWAGNSGLLGESEGKDYGIHLHFEIWIDGYYLGKGMDMKDIRQYFTWIFLMQ